MHPKYLIEADERNGFPVLVLEMDSIKYQSGSKKDAVLESQRIISSLPEDKKIYVLGIGNFALTRQLQVLGLLGRCVLCGSRLIEGDFILQNLVKVCGEEIQDHICWVDESTQARQIPYDPLFDPSIHVLNTALATIYRRTGLVDLNQILENRISALQNDFVTQSVFGKLWHRNISLNTRYLMTNLPSLEMPVVTDNVFLVLGAGPGTGILGPRIKEWLVQNPGVMVLCADTIARHLRSIVDPGRIITMTVDPQIHSCFHFIGISEDSLHFRDLGTHSSLFRTGKVIPMAGPHYLSRYLLEGSGYPFQLESPGRNVGHAMVSFLEARGVKDIFTLGMDFCSVHGQNYSKSTMSHLDSLGLQNRFVPLEALFIDSSRASENDGTFRNSLLVSYDKDFSESFSGHKNIHRISWNSDPSSLLPTCTALSEKRIKIDLSDFNPGIGEKMDLFFQFCLDWLNSSNYHDLSAMKTQWDTGFWILYPLIACHYRNNLKNGMKVSDSRDKASQASLEYALSMAEHWPKRG